MGLKEKEMKEPVALRKFFAYFFATMLFASAWTYANPTEASEDSERLTFVADYSSCIDAMGMPDKEIKGDVSMLSAHKKRLKKYQNKRTRRIEKLNGLLAESGFAENLLARNSLDGAISKLTDKERKIVREIIRVSNNLWKKELKLYGLLAGWGYIHEDIPNLSLWSCHLIAAKANLPSYIDLSLDVKDELELAVITPIGKGVLAIAGVMSLNQKVSKENIKRYGSDVLGDLRLIVDQCEIGTELGQNVESLAENNNFVEATNFLCNKSRETDFKIIWGKSQRFYETGIRLYSDGIEKVDKNSEYATLYKEIEALIYGGRWSKMVDEDVARQKAVANLNLVLYRELTESCAELPCRPQHQAILSGIKKLAIAEERKNTKYFFPIKRLIPPDIA